MALAWDLLLQWVFRWASATMVLHPPLVRRPLPLALTRPRRLAYMGSGLVNPIHPTQFLRVVVLDRHWLVQDLGSAHPHPHLRRCHHKMHPDGPRALQMLMGHHFRNPQWAYSRHLLLLGRVQQATPSVLEQVERVLSLALEARRAHPSWVLEAREFSVLLVSWNENASSSGIATCGSENSPHVTGN